MVIVPQCRNPIDPEFEKAVKEKINEKGLCDEGKTKIKDGPYGQEFLQHITGCMGCYLELVVTEQFIRSSWGM